jgi:hypothetical protein
LKLAVFAPLGASQKLTIVQCSGSGTPIGVLDSTTCPQIDENQIAAIDKRPSRIAKALQD